MRESVNNLKICIPLIVFTLFFASCDNPFIDSVLDIKIITFESNGGSPVDSQRIFRGEKIMMPQPPAKTGHAFAGWFTEDYEEWDFDIVPEDDLTLYADWESVGISLTPRRVIFPQEAMGYQAMPPVTITVTNIDNFHTGSLSVLLTGEDADCFILSSTSIGNINAGSFETFTITPNTGLPPGTYSANINVTNLPGGGIISTNVYVSFTVKNAVITNANVNIGSPSPGTAPNTASGVNPNDNYTAGAVSWSPNNNPFTGGVSYTATVTLTAKENYAFSQTGFSATFNNLLTAVTANNSGNSVTVSYQFPELITKIVTGLTITSQPAQADLTYIHGDSLNLSGLAVRLDFDDSTFQADITPAIFAVYGISASAGGVPVSHGDFVSFSGAYKDLPITVSTQGISANTTSQIVITRRSVTIGVTASNKIYDGTVTAVINSIPVINGNRDGANLTVLQGTAVFNDKNTGTGKPVVFAGWDLGGLAKDNYILAAQPTSVTANITPRTVTITNINHTKPYDGNTSANITAANASANGILSGDNVNIGAIAAAYTSPNAGTQTMIINVLELTGSDIANYVSMPLPALNIPVTGGIVKIDPVVNWPETAFSAFYGQTLSVITLPGNGTGTAGAFVWTYPDDYAGNVGTRTHNMTFMPQDFTNYNQMTRNYSVTVLPKAITSATITVTAPVAAEQPNATAEGEGDFSIGTVLWTDNGVAHNSTFHGGTAYTANVTLTANANHTFEGLSAGPNPGMTINGITATVGAISGTSITLSAEFPKTAARIVTKLEAVSSPPPVVYCTHGEPLNLSGITVKVSFDDNTQEILPFSQFSLYNISTTPENGTHITRFEYHNLTVTTVYNDDTSIQVISNRLNVAKAQGAAVTAVTITDLGSNSFRIDTSLANNSPYQKLEYAFSETSGASANDLLWQASNIVFLLTSNPQKTYYFYARSAGNDEYHPGTVQQSAQSKTL